MPRNYRNVSMYEQEILEMKSQGKTLREIGKQLGFSYEQVHNFTLLFSLVPVSIFSISVIHFLFQFILSSNRAQNIVLYII